MESAHHGSDKKGDVAPEKGNYQRKFGYVENFNVANIEFLQEIVKELVSQEMLGNCYRSSANDEIDRWIAQQMIGLSTSI